MIHMFQVISVFWLGGGTQANEPKMQKLWGNRYFCEDWGPCLFVCFWG